MEPEMIRTFFYILYAPLRLWRAVFPLREEQLLIPVMSKRIITINEGSIPFRDHRGLCKPAAVLLSEGLLNPEEAITVRMLVLARDRRGRKLNLRKFARGEGVGKTSIEYFEEVRKGEAKTRLRNDRRYQRIAKRIRVRLLNKDRTLELVEVGRGYYRMEPKFVRKTYAVSGCIQEDELRQVQIAAWREVLQELGEALRKLGIELPLDVFKVTSAPKGPGDEHESDAYYEGLSINQDYDVEGIVDPWPDDWSADPPVIDDTSVQVFTQVQKVATEQDNATHENVKLTRLQRIGLERMDESPVLAVYKK
jgi:hypothetical protein